MWPKATDLNLLSGSILYLSVHLYVWSSVGLLLIYVCLSGPPQDFLDPNECIVVLDPYTENEYKYISSVGVQHRDAFIPQWGPVKLMCLSLCLSVVFSASTFDNN